MPAGRLRAGYRPADGASDANELSPASSSRAARRTSAVTSSRTRAGGTRFTYDHTGFTGVGGFFLAKLLGSVRKRMLTVGLPAVLDDLDETGALRAASTLRAKPRT
jgi:hypothetical protein